MKKISTVDVDLNGYRITGDENSLCFYKVYEDHGRDDEPHEDFLFELTWPEILKACQKEII